MTMRPPPQMGPPRTPAAADQTTSGFAFAQATWDAYFDQSCALTLTTTGSGSEAGGGQPETETTFRVYTVGGLSLPDAAKGAAARDFESVAPVYVLLHGGGLSSLSWALVLLSPSSENTRNQMPAPPARSAATAKPIPSGRKPLRRLGMLPNKGLLRSSTIVIRGGF